MIFASSILSSDFSDTASLVRPSDTKAIPPNLEELIAKRVEEKLQAMKINMPAPPCRKERTGVDVVIVHHCEDLKWLQKIRPERRLHLRLFLYDKPGKSCDATDKSTLPADLTVIQEVLPNIAKDGHGQLHHVVKHYDDLARHTFFLQAGYHWTMRADPHRKLKGWSSQADCVNDVIPKLSDDIKFRPLTAYSEETGPRLHVDKEDDTDPPDYERTHVEKFSTGWSDMYMRGREMYAMMFGGTPCAAKGQTFAAGMQYVVHRDNLRQRPLDFWNKMLSQIMKCDPHYGYAMERMTSAIFDGPTKTLDPHTWKTLSFCRQGAEKLDMHTFSTPLKRFETAEVWRKEWGCEPLSQRLLVQKRKRGHQR